MENPSIALIPSAFKPSKLYSVLPSNGNGDFTHTRSTTATRVNADGLIETSAIDTPRIDYSDGGCPVLLLEPQSTNSLLQSNQFDTTWINQLGGTIVGGKFSEVSGLNDAWEFTKDATAFRSVRQAIVLASSTYTYSVYLKKGTLNNAALRIDTGGGAGFVNIDLLNGLITSTSGPLTSSKITLFKDGWYRCEGTLTQSITNVHIYVGEAGGTISGSIFCQYAQLEQLPYATSYIPTKGTTVTRTADVCNNAGNVNTFNSEEGVLFVEMAALINQDSSQRSVSINDGTKSNRAILFYDDANNRIRVRYTLGGVDQVSFAYVFSDATNTNLIAFKYKENDFSLWVNGIEVATDLSGSVSAIDTFSNLSFNEGDGTDVFFGKVKQLQVFKTALTDAELITLTTL